ncbi:MAG TPA: sulfurtransferase TusA family protein [Acidobacteriota bacterium]|nr:sulfurtransferase TusA family protein [Acidobacteriota bacterium]
MATTKTVDACGLSCPQPVLMTRQAIGSMDHGSVHVLVDSATARDNVIRTAQKAGWHAELKDQGGSRFEILLTK